MAKKQSSGITELAKASLHRLDDARTLLAAQRWQGAMYMAGYAVECLLKTKLMQRYRCRTLNQLDEALVKKGQVAADWSIYSHELVAMMNLLGCQEQIQADRAMRRHFSFIGQWSPAWRYTSSPGTKTNANEFLFAVERMIHWIEANT